MIGLKDNSVNPRSLSPQALLGIMITQSILAEYESDLIITSLNDATHSTHSAHYRGDAWDVRIWYIAGKEQEVVKKLKLSLSKHYLVLLETDHIHIEYKPVQD